MKKIVFIEPAANKVNVYESYMRLPLMGTLYLGTILSQQGYDVEIYNENLMQHSVDPMQIHAHIFCITALTVTANRAKSLATQLKWVYPDAMILIGGIHASLAPEEFVNFADHVVVGEGEQVIVDLVEGRYTDTIIQGQPVADMDALPLVNYSLLKDASKMDILPIMTSRGCPFNCSFCTVTQIFGHRFRKQSPERILQEIENAYVRFNARSLFFYDDNFASDKKRLHHLCELMENTSFTLPLAAQVRTDLTKDPELVEKLAKVGLEWVYTGFESINDETLKAFNKSQTRNDIERAIACFHEHGINVHGMFVFGDDHDTVETIAQTVDFAIEQAIDTVQFMILTPFPGTACYDEMVKANRLYHTNWDYYNAMFAVFRPRHMSAERLVVETHKAYRKFYSIRRSILDLIWQISGVTLDALVWNFGNANRSNLNYLFFRMGARAIVARYTDICGTYIKYLEELEKQQVLADASPVTPGQQAAKTDE